ncbi:MAG: IS66 family transposase [gamma proteobacterium endosymbiont of Lamellibrachia anaximandri]|nr:IS66 family transposase [gamma proteobacterium endosymbiont of Lamellibrachia anaximandri]
MVIKSTVQPNLPDDIEALKRLLLGKERQVKTLQARLDQLEEAMRKLLNKQYGPSSEKDPTPQMRLFNEPEAVDADVEPVEEAVTVPEHRRRTSGRKSLPEHLPRIEVEHDLDEAEKVCRCGCQLTRIGEETSEQLDIIPATIQVIRHHRIKYACQGCEETVRTAKLPPQPIPKSNASPGLLAHITVAKFQDALPLARQEKMFARIGAEIPRATLARWMIQLGLLVQPLINLMRDHLLGYDVMGMDETRIQVLKEPDRIASSQSFIWVQRGGPPNQAVVLFHYNPSRGGEAARELLAGYSGFLMVDGYAVYDALEKTRPEIRLVGCMAHARRKCFEADKAQGKKGRSGKARMGLSLIQKLYGIEQSIKDKSPEEKQAIREERATPVLEELHTWALRSVDEVAPTSLTGKALTYLLGQWPKLIRYLEEGRLAIDNNATERAIRPFVIGRRNWLFADTPKGATASANLYSLIETAKANGIEPYHYLRHVFSALPGAETVDQLEALMPSSTSDTA